VTAELRDRVVVLIPALDEAESIGEVVRAVPETVAGVPTVTIVIDDGSSDATAERAAEAGALVSRHETNRGGGAALRTGYRLAIGGAAAVVVTLDADGQHLPEEIPALVEPVLAGRADLAVGSRTLGSAEPGVFARELGIAVFNRVVSVLARRRVTDCSNGFRAIRTEALAELDLRQEQFHAAEFLLEALTRGVPTIEVPVTVAARRHGQTKKPRTLRYGVGFARAILSAWTRSLGRPGDTSRRTGRTPAAAERSAA
jgi:glycosyltransferase involved in cell wall biosynthesis